MSMTAMWLPSPNVTGSQFAGTDDRTLPAWAAQPYLWQQTFSEDPNGPAKLVFETGHSLDLDTSLVVVGRDDSFRLVYLDPGELMGSLSPDGRYLLGDNLVDLVTGQSRKLSPAVSSHWPAVWSPDSQSAVAVIGQDDVVPTTGPNGERINDSTRLDNIVIVSVPDGSLRVVHVAEADVFRAAFSPDGTRVAIAVGRDAQNKELLILDVATGAVQRAVSLGERQQIAGSAAWSPDGNRLILTFIEGCLTAPSCDGPTLTGRPGSGSTCNSSMSTPERSRTRPSVACKIDRTSSPGGKALRSCRLPTTRTTHAPSCVSRPARAPRLCHCGRRGTGARAIPAMHWSSGPSMAHS
ncbi:WD40 repeat domain-containing protein [Catellatospora coxensis]